MFIGNKKQLHHHIKKDLLACKIYIDSNLNSIFFPSVRSGHVIMDF